jgi:peptidoglycan/LPS O-acetylase OafA/YrhL
MPLAFSAYLEIIRLSAALMVFAHHVSYPRFGGWLSLLGGYGHESVIVFFVLSGFVVAYSQENKDRTVQQYTASRLSRLWSVALPTIILTLFFDAAGRTLSPETYAGLCEPSVFDLFAAVFFLNEIWHVEGCVGTNIPYWSLSYEFFYYCLFGIYAFASPRFALFRWLALSFVALLIGPKVLLLLPCWALGVAAFYLSKQSISRNRAILLSLGGLALFCICVYFKIGNKFITWRLEALIGPLWSERLGHSTAFISDNLLGMFFAVHVLGMSIMLRTVHIARSLLSLLQKIASATFAIYLIHYPCLFFFTAVSLRISGVVDGVMVGLSSLAVPIILTMPTEIFKRKLRSTMLTMLSISR